MLTLIIYDNTGYIYLQMTGNYRIPNGAIQYLEVDSAIHENKIIKSINVETKELILEYIPLSEIEILKKKIAEQETALVELASLAGGNV